MKRHNYTLLKDWQVRHALTHDEIVVVVPMKPQPFTNTVRLERHGDEYLQVIDDIAGGGTVAIGNIQQRLRPPHLPGTTVAGKEAWQYFQDEETGRDSINYLVDGSLWPFPNDQHHPCMAHCVGRFGIKNPAQHMPRWACRLWLTERETRVVRVGEITEADAKVAGIAGYHQSEAMSSGRALDRWARCSVLAAKRRGQPRPGVATNIGALEMHLHSRYPAAEWFWLTRFSVRVGGEA